MRSPFASRVGSFTKLAVVCIAAAAALAVPSAASAAAASNGIYSVDISDSGNFTASTGASHPAGADLRLTFPNGGRWLLHSYTSGSDYALADNGTPGTVSDIAGGKGFQYSMPGDSSLDVRQDVTISGTTVEDSMVRVALRVQNTGQAPVKIGARSAIDFMIANDDGPVFTPQGGQPLSAAERYVNPTFGTFTLEDNDMGSPTLRGVWSAAAAGLGLTPPDVLEMADCCQGSAAPLLPALPLSSSYIEVDNEVRWIWGQDDAHGRTLAPGESVTFAIGSTLGDINAVPAPPVNDVPPAITGTTSEGQTLTSTLGDWTAAALTSYAYQWQRCDAQGAACVDVAGATTDQYLLTAADVGHTMRMQVTADGAVSAQSAATEVVAAPDTVAPETTIDDGPSGITSHDAATFTFSSEVGAQFECKLDDGAWAGCTSPHALTGLTDGSHTFQVRAIDAAANVDATPASSTWTVDTTPPVMPPTDDAAPAPDGAPTPPPAPKSTPTFTATWSSGDGAPYSGMGTTPSGITAVTAANNGVDVGCRMTGIELASCRVELYAYVDEDTARRAGAATTRRMLVGTGRVEADVRTNRLAVRVELNQLGRTLMRRSPTGLTVRAVITGRPTSGRALEVTSTVRLVPTTARLLVGRYGPDRSTLPAGARRALRRLADSLAPGARIRVVGHTDNSWRDGDYLRRLGRKRATAVVRYLRASGVQATYVVRSAGATRPRATNHTDAGRARNRRVALTIVR